MGLIFLQRLKGGGKARWGGSERQALPTPHLLHRGPSPRPAGTREAAQARDVAWTHGLWGRHGLLLRGQSERRPGSSEHRRGDGMGMGCSTYFTGGVTQKCPVPIEGLHPKPPARRPNPGLRLDGPPSPQVITPPEGLETSKCKTSNYPVGSNSR